MPCDLDASDVLDVVVEALKRYVPPRFYVTEHTPIHDLPISVERWEVNVYPDVRRALRVLGCCFQSLQPDELYGEPETVGALAALIHADLGDCNA